MAPIFVTSESPLGSQAGQNFIKYSISEFEREPDYAVGIIGDTMNGLGSIFFTQEEINGVIRAFNSDLYGHSNIRASILAYILSEKVAAMNSVFDVMIRVDESQIRETNPLLLMYDVGEILERQDIYAVDLDQVSFSVFPT